MGGKFQWPALDDVIEYRRKVRHLILDVIEKTQLELPITMDSPWVCVIKYYMDQLYLVIYAVWRSVMEDVCFYN